MKVREYIKDNILVFDGAMGIMLQNLGLKLGECPEIFNITNEEEIIKIHKSYINAGAKVIRTNTFGANELKLKNTDYSVEEIIKSGVDLAKKARGNKDCYIALDIGPIGELLEPMGNLNFEKAIDIFKRQIKVGEQNGVDLILIDSMNDLYEMKAAIIAAKESCSLPIFTTMTFEEDGGSFTGCLPESMAITLEGLGVDAIGVNCSLRPKELKNIVEKIINNTNLPVIVQSNEVYDINKEGFLNSIRELVRIGVSIIGGGFETTYKFIEEISKITKDSLRINRKRVTKYAVTSPFKVVEIDEARIVGERINSSGKKLFKEAIMKNDMDYILNLAIEQVEGEADILDINLSIKGIDEEGLMEKAIKKIQSNLDIPLQIDSINRKAIEKGLRVYNGKPIINSINGEDDVLDSILPLAKKYGAAIVGLTLDNNGIPKDYKSRFKIAEKIVKRAIECGIKREDIYIDCLALTVLNQQDQIMETLKALRMVKERLDVKTILGISNVSFGLKDRDSINETFLALALGAGLDLPIMNPNKKGMMEVIKSFKLLNNNISINKKL